MHGKVSIRRTGFDPPVFFSRVVPRFRPVSSYHFKKRELKNAEAGICSKSGEPFGDSHTKERIRDGGISSFLRKAKGVQAAMIPAICRLPERDITTQGLLLFHLPALLPEVHSRTRRWRDLHPCPSIFIAIVFFRFHRTLILRAVLMCGTSFITHPTRVLLAPHTSRIPFASSPTAECPHRRPMRIRPSGKTLLSIVVVSLLFCQAPTEWSAEWLIGIAADQGTRLRLGWMALNLGQFFHHPCKPN